MKNISIKISLLLFLLFLIHYQSFSQEKKFSKAVLSSINQQMKVYPKSTLKDLYKNFFQDEFGPGHLIKDSAMAGEYLRKELALSSSFSEYIAEPTGMKGNFYRVNLSVVKNGTIPYSTFLNAMLRSANDIQVPNIEDWQKKWQKIESIISNYYPNLPNFSEDKIAIDNALSKGIYIGHHSQAYNETYSPHYRIIQKKIYKKEILPLLKKQK